MKDPEREGHRRVAISCVIPVRFSNNPFACRAKIQKIPPKNPVIPLFREIPPRKIPAARSQIH
jgi:hypothetical protein